MRTSLAILVAVCVLFGLHVVSNAAAVQVLTDEAITRELSSHLLKRCNVSEAQATVKRLSYRGDLQLPAGKVELDVVIPEQWPGYGTTTAALIIRVDGLVRKNISFSAEVDVFGDVVTMTRTLSRGEKVERTDVQLSRKNFSQLHGKFLTSVDSAVGMIAKNTLLVNTPLRSDQIEKEPVVVSGQMVTIIAENEILHVSVRGTAKKSGAVGDIIQVRSVSSQRDISAKVIDSSTVKVEF